MPLSLPPSGRGAVLIMQTPLCGSCWLHGLTCSCSARLSRKHPQDASTTPPQLPVPFCTPLSGRSSSHGSAARRNLAAGRRLQTCCPEHLGGAGKSSAPRSATQPAVPADGHGILLLSPSVCPSCPGATRGVGPAPVCAGLQGAAVAAPLPSTCPAEQFPELALSTSVWWQAHKAETA